ncbi:MAG: hypothetical protein DHS20C21_13090 [Gemmatimonadota bacterium]|nr:MAG: hypothetical protein DHS20C21_13090 [Gemmatimonadota bacterium]
MRITENMIAMNFLRRSGSALSTMANAQEQLASGRRLLRPSDDPSGLAKSLALNSDLRRVTAHVDNASSATAFMSSTESSLQEISDLISRAKELMVAGQNATSDGEGADAQATELRSLIDSLMLVANREVGGRALFGGRETQGKAYQQIGGNIVYRGDHQDILEEIGNGLRVGVNMPGPKAFQTVPSKVRGNVDLDPLISTTTPLNDLFDGRGAMPATIQVTDGNGITSEVQLGGAENIGQVLDAINNSGTAIVATISADGKSVELTDTSGGGSFSVQDIQGGSLARTLGIASTSDTGTIRGFDLDPVVNENTPMALLLNGAGIPGGLWTLRNDKADGALTAQIDPSQANTVGDLLRMINGAKTPNGEPLGLRASIEGRSLTIQSVHRQSTVTIEDAAPGGSASQLGVAGIGEALDVFTLLERAALAVEQRDTDAIDAAIRDATQAVEQTAGIRGTYGARARQVLSMSENLRDQQVDLTIRLSDVEDADLANAAVQLAKAETIYNASLATGTKMLELSLFNYIR